jgi:hypothetical protein
MARIKNSNRKKRKYDARRESITERNRAARRAKAPVLLQKALDRTLNLVGRQVKYGGTKQYPWVGKVVGLASTSDADHIKGGSVLVIEKEDGDTVYRLRRRVSLAGH